MVSSPGVGALIAAGSTDADADDTTVRILDAALGTLLDFGVRKLSVEDVARRAGVARVTIYRRFSNKEELLVAVLVREGSTIFSAVDAVIDGIDDPEHLLVEGFVACFSAARSHPLLARTLATEPELLAQTLITHGAPVLAVAREYLAGHVRAVQSSGRLRSVDARGAAELAVRMTSSFLLTPDSVIALDDEDDLRAFARRYLLPTFRSLADPRPEDDR